MDGVTILNTIVSGGYGTIGTTMIIFGIIVFFLSLLSVTISYEPYNKTNGEFIISIIVAIISFILIIIGIGFAANSTETTTYEVTISEEVLFKDFTSKYEIIEQRGDIYVVKKREQNNKENQNQ